MVQAYRDIYLTCLLTSAQQSITHNQYIQNHTETLMIRNNSIMANDNH